MDLQALFSTILRAFVSAKKVVRFVFILYTFCFADYNIEKGLANTSVMDTLLENYPNATKEEIAEEYLAHLAEKLVKSEQFTEAEQSVWDKFKEILQQFIELMYHTNYTLSDKQVAMIVQSTVAEMNKQGEIIENKENNVKFAKKEKDGISESISQGEYGKNSEEVSRTEEAWEAELRGRITENQRNAQANSENVSRAEIEARTTEEYAKEKGLWIPYSDVMNMGAPYLGGNENDNYLNEVAHAVYKVNNLMNNKGLISETLRNTNNHNKIFKNAQLEFVGFTGFDGGSVYPIFKQQYVADAIEASPDEIAEYMQSLGFEKVNTTTFNNGTYTVSDLRPRNVLKDVDGDIYVIDSEAKNDGEVRFSKVPQAKDYEDAYEFAKAQLAYSRNAKNPEIAMAEAEVDTQPTEKQKEAGNYKKGHVKVQGLDISIEQPRGSVRSGVDKDGKEWSVTMNNTYGYFKGTKGRDGDHIDTFLGDNLESDKVFVIDQVDDKGKFDEHKVMLGFNTEQEAKEAYLSNYSEGWQGLGAVTEMSVDELKKWAKTDGKRVKPVSELVRFSKEFLTPLEPNGDELLEFAGLKLVDEIKTKEEIADYNARVERLNILYANKALNLNNAEDIEDDYLFSEYGDNRYFEEVVEEKLENLYNLEDEDLKSGEEEAVDYLDELNFTAHNLSIEELVVQSKGDTDLLGLAGYIMPDGILLDFSGGQGDRYEDHRQLNIPIKGYYQGTELMERFKNTAGAVRIDGDRGSIDINKKPTANQMAIISQIIRRNMSDYNVDLSDGERRISIQNSPLEFTLDYIKQFYNDKSLGDSLGRDVISFSKTVEMQGIEKKAKAKDTFMKAPNGKSTNLNERQWLQVRTKAFKEWFGDWEKSPEKASKVVDENREPLVVYHGTDSEFTEFDKDKSNYGGTSQGFNFFTNKKDAYPDSATDYAGEEGKVIETFLNIRKPIKYDSAENYNTVQFYDANHTYIRKDYRKGDFDGIIIENNNKDRDESVLLAVENPSQIKSATDNVGTFDEGNGDIRFSLVKQDYDLSVEKERYNGSDYEVKGNDVYTTVYGVNENTPNYTEHIESAIDIDEAEQGALNSGVVADDNYTTIDIDAKHLKIPIDAIIEEYGLDIEDYENRSDIAEEYIEDFVRDVDFDNYLKGDDFYNILQSQEDNADTDQTIYDVKAKLSNEFGVNVRKYTNFYVDRDGNMTNEMYDTANEDLENLEVSMRIADHTHNPRNGHNDLNVLIAENDHTSDRQFVRGARIDLEYDSDATVDEIVEDIKEYWKDYARENYDDIRFSKQSSLGFYSTVDNALDKIQQNKGTKDQFRAMLLKNGAKQAEMDWMGFDELPNKLTKQDIQKWIEASKIEIEEVEPSTGAKELTKDQQDEVDEMVANDLVDIEIASDIEIREKYEIDNEPIFLEDGYYLGEANEEDVNSIARDSGYEDYEALFKGMDYDLKELKKQKVKDKRDRYIKDLFGSSVEYKYSRWQLPNGENYKELLLTMPILDKKKYNKAEQDRIRIFNKWEERGITVVEAREQYPEEVAELEEANELLQKASPSAFGGEGNVFKSSHFDEPNILAHIRFNERTDAEGDRVLFLEEIQSDWAQEGKKKGFSGRSKTYTLDNTSLEKTEYGYKLLSSNGLILSDLSDTATEGLSEIDIQRELLMLANRYSRNEEERKTPNMPFKKTDQWVSLALRRMMRYATENGFAKIAWATGEQQAERYDLSNQLNEISTVKLNNGFYNVFAYDKNGRDISLGEMPENDLADNIGKNLAEKVIKDSKTEKRNTYTGLDLSVGGEGMKDFYNKIVPSAAKKVGKPFRSVPQIIEIDGIGKQLALPVTEEMQESVMEYGVPLFSKQAPVMPEKPKSEDYQTAGSLAEAQGKWLAAMREWRKTNDKYQAEKRTYKEKWMEMVFDKYRTVKKLQEDVEKAVGRKLSDNENAYVKELLRTSRGKQEMEDFQEHYMAPLSKAVKVLQKKTKAEYKDVSMYMLAKHAVERNAYMAEHKEVENGSGIETKEAEQIVKEFESKADKASISELWNQVNKATRYALDKQHRSGLLSLDLYKHIKGMYKHYVPMRGWDEETSGDLFDYMNRPFPKSSLQKMKKAEGRSSLSDDPLPYVASMAESSILMGGKNEVRQALLKMVRNHPQPELYGLQKVWMVNKGTKETPEWVEELYKPSDEVIKSGMAYEKRNEIKGHKVTPMQAQAHQVEVWENGRKLVMDFVRPDIAAAVKGENIQRGGMLDKVVDRASGLTRMLSRNFTSRNPSFTMVNMVRDMSYAAVMNGVKHGSGKEFMGNVGKCGASLHKMIFNKNWDGKSNEIDGYLKEFLQMGGETGFLYLRDIEAHRKEIRRMLKNLRDPSLLNSMEQKGMSVLEFVEKGNRWAEDLSRFTTYYTLRKRGMTPQQAAYEAKEITVNFNRQGTISSFVGSLYAFFNAAMQGVYNFGDAAVKNKKAVGSVAFGMFALGVVAPMLARFIGGADDEDNYYYDMLPDYERSNHFIFALGGNDFVKIPLPHILRAFYGWGESIDGYRAGKKDASETMRTMLGNFVDDLSPVSLSGGGLRAMMPTAVIPLYDNMVNENFAGYQVYKEPHRTQEGKRPQHDLASNYTNELLVAISRLSNKFGGGSDNRSASVRIKNGEPEYSWIGDKFDWNPSKVEHVIEHFGGGMLTFLNNTYKLGAHAVNKAQGNTSEYEAKNMPIARRFYRKAKSKSIASQYFDLKKENEDYEYFLKKDKADGNHVEYTEMLRNTPRYRQMQMLKIFDKQLKKYRKMEEMANGNKAVLQNIENAKEQLYKQAVKQIRELKQAE